MSHLATHVRTQPLRPSTTYLDTIIYNKYVFTWRWRILCLFERHKYGGHQKLVTRVLEKHHVIYVHIVVSLAGTAGIYVANQAIPVLLEPLMLHYAKLLAAH